MDLWKISFFTGQKVGQDVGFYIGRIDANKGSWYGDFKKAIESSVNFAYVNPFQANKLDVAGKVTSNPHIAITGDIGGGKSFLTKYLFLYSSLLRKLKHSILTLKLKCDGSILKF